ncbi:peptidase M75, Imelysin [Mesorhizobium loti]|nr:imelysin family protein [Mesorhizobium loti]PLP56149.1 peptidase M75, Imelysin [Mesorhizobium loti]
MLKHLFIALVLPLGLAVAGPASAAVQASDVVNGAVDGFIRPAYASLQQHTASTAKAVKALCATPSQQALDAARVEFAGAVTAWSTIEIVRFGPITENNRLERMLYWPDRKGLGLKQVQAAVADKDASAADAAGIAGKSIAMQGLGALEFVLHGTDAETLAGKDGAYRCAYGLAIAGNVETIATDVSAAWAKPDGFAAQWASPSPDNPLYRDGSEAVTELMGAFINGLELVRDQRLKSFFGASSGEDKPKQAIYWRSGLTGAALAANLDGMNRLFQASNLGDALPKDERWIADSIEIQLVNGIAAAGKASGSAAEVLADPKRRAALEHFQLITSSLSNLFGTRLSAAFGLTAGFSSLDGD